MDIWKEGLYDVRAAAVDAAGNESAILTPGSVFVDTTLPVLRRLTVSEITEGGFSLRCVAADNGELTDIRVQLVSDQGTLWEEHIDPKGPDTVKIAGLGEGVWSIAVTAMDACRNERSYTFTWQYTAGQALPGRTITHYGN